MKETLYKVQYGEFLERTVCPLFIIHQIHGTSVGFDLKGIIKTVNFGSPVYLDPYQLKSVLEELSKLGHTKTAITPITQ